MGQRLVVNLYKNKKRVASIYYHWSAYFVSTIVELSLLSEDILNAEKENKDPLLGILEGLENRGGGLRGGGMTEYRDDLNAALSLFPKHKFKTDVSRNKGLITFAEKSMEFFDAWSEGYALIDLDTHKIKNGVSFNGEDWIEYDYEPVGEDAKGGIIQSAKSGVVRKGDKTCRVNAFDLTCEDIFELYEFMKLYANK